MEAGIPTIWSVTVTALDAATADGDGVCDLEGEVLAPRETLGV